LAVNYLDDDLARPLRARQLLLVACEDEAPSGDVGIRAALCVAFDLL
jgi:hypothetical protein